MTHALNLTLPLKQDPESQKALAHLGEIFAAEVQPKIDEKLRESRLVHFARVVVIDNKYIQVITEYEGSHEEYTEWFRRELTPVFAAIFSLADGAPDVADPASFWNYASRHNVRSLGKSVDGSTTLSGEPAGYLFSAYGGRTVAQIQDGLGIVIADQDASTPA
ncbi:MAG TPA: hypothetical protein PKA33_14815 [Amaricoccus sp.]|uniref:hypothetical protein n=1 Tax=Amaricoccus sp. TaxID=1872485 RepID=UPI002BFE7D88|nr:hypothetical protein [Amaricoccus sp.]HMQ93799.1 hypothetical protein [Amaricoccus sp.]HMR53519.1 hypothetical protein [Amaricoccus sp.]HMR60825.1 hypothetical protein [Amaricoccus sp.]HMU00621.1 hypothetical protein [Amaricoccus sp.]